MQLREWVASFVTCRLISLSLCSLFCLVTSSSLSVETTVWLGLIQRLGMGSQIKSSGGKFKYSAISENRHRKGLEHGNITNSRQMLHPLHYDEEVGSSGSTHCLLSANASILWALDKYILIFLTWLLETIQPLSAGQPLACPCWHLSLCHTVPGAVPFCQSGHGSVFIHITGTKFRWCLWMLVTTVLLL